MQGKSGWKGVAALGVCSAEFQKKVRAAVRGFKRIISQMKLNQEEVQDRSGFLQGQPALPAAPGLFWAFPVGEQGGKMGRGVRSGGRSSGR